MFLMIRGPFVLGERLFVLLRMTPLGVGFAFLLRVVLEVRLEIAACSSFA